MRTISFKISESLHRDLDRLASRRHTTRSAVLREAISVLSGRRKRSAAELAGELVGSLRGSSDLSASPVSKTYKLKAKDRVLRVIKEIKDFRAARALKGSSIRAMIEEGRR